jgi:hypothetical protein
VWTGEVTNSDGSLGQNAVGSQMLHCIECGKVHPWSLINAYLDGEPMKGGPGPEQTRAVGQSDGGGELAGKA